MDPAVTVTPPFGASVPNVEPDANKISDNHVLWLAEVAKQVIPSNGSTGARLDTASRRCRKRHGIRQLQRTSHPVSRMRLVPI